VLLPSASAAGRVGAALWLGGAKVSGAAVHKPYLHVEIPSKSQTLQQSLYKKWSLHLTYSSMACSDAQWQMRRVQDRFRQLRYMESVATVARRTINTMLKPSLLVLSGTTEAQESKPFKLLMHLLHIGCAARSSHLLVSCPHLLYRILFNVEMLSATTMLLICTMSI
jgi:hypothetical protein